MLEASLWLASNDMGGYMKVFVYKRGKDSSEEYARDALSRFTGRKKEEFVFEYARYGKPYTNGAFFSLSHSGGYLICAVAENEVGADIERVRIVRYADKIAKRCFFPKNVQGESFIEEWVKKEARLKYRGTGFANGAAEEEENLFVRVFSFPEGCKTAVCAKEEENVEFVKLFY